MHESIQSDISPPDTESQPYPVERESDDGSNTGSHPWHQLRTITTFEQMSTSGCSSGRTVCSEEISRTSRSSKSSCCTNDESINLHQPHNSITTNQQLKKYKDHNKNHSDPSHDRAQPGQGSRSSESQSHHDGSNSSLKHKLSSNESICLSNRQYSASIDERASAPQATNDYRVAVNGAKTVRAMNNTLSASLMIESLIDQICKMMIRDPKTQQAMYKIICERLFDMGMIDKTYAVDELQIIRNHYQKALYQMFAMGRSASQASHQSEYLLPVPNVKIDFPIGQSVMEVSRYKDEFVELEFLAKGGFGKVYRVQHRLDGASYAVKKIFFRSNDQVLKSFQEVKMLANLNHPNIVSYKAAWIEPVECKDFESISSSSTRSTGTGTDTNNSSNCFKMDLPPGHHGDRQESEDIIFAESAGGGAKLGAGDLLVANGNPKITIECVTEKVTKRTATVTCNSSSSVHRSVVSSAVSSAVQPFRSSTYSKEIRHKKRVELAVLYVQMQLCEVTLRDWLDYRNAKEDLSIVNIIPGGLILFQQIVRGVEYVHNKHIVHHDIKPSNVFVSKDLSSVQVGDFGLSCYFKGDHGSNIGTPLYAAPEQLAGECNPKSDIFSLGIILVEILIPFQTTMERAATLSNLRKGKVPVQLENTVPATAALVRRLIEPKSELRPTATELLKELQNVERLKCAGHCLVDKNKLIDELSAKYKAVIESKDKEILELKKRLLELERSQKV